MSSRSLLRPLAMGVAVGLVVLLLTTGMPRVGWAPPLIKIGVVNWEQVILKYDAFQQELSELEERRKKILQFIEEEYGKLDRRKLKRGSDTETLSQELQNIYEGTLKQLKKRRQRTIEQHHNRILEAIRQEAIEQGFSLILSENEVLYAAEGYTDLTSNVIQRLNKNKNKNSTTNPSAP